MSAPTPQPHPAAATPPPAVPQTSVRRTTAPRTPDPRSVPSPGSPAPYESPIPIVRAHLGHALRAEWTKIRTVRSTLWTLGVFELLVVGVGLVFAATVGERMGRGDRVTLFAFPGLLLGTICLLTLGVLVISSEYGTGLVRPTLTAAPQRHRVLAAKFLVFSAISFVAVLVATGIVATAGAAFVPAGADLHWGGPALLASLYLSLLGVVALATGTMLRHSAGAIAAMLGVYFLPTVLPIFLVNIEATETLGRKVLEYSAPNALSLLLIPDQGGNGLPQLALLAVLTAAVAGCAFAVLHRRDV
ncbi:ABC transporter permease subunit [Streptomyces sp. SPB074]|uniref:ABC transporter permease subunit n=1 Tax=Streptomyces sp. (strain SPB074) TaxID=465543 RepID=UPI00017FEEBC|nr:ABC transporter permease subunit [Streptomyces sp. SPB074]EDY45970.1 ABC transporter integral membrane subunit [Streptomyces sp. SPB074]